MFVHAHELRDIYDFEIPDGADLEARRAESCVICAAPPLSRSSQKLHIMQWFAKYDPENLYLREIMEGATEVVAGRSAADEEPVRFEDAVSRAVLDSSLRATIPIPESILGYVRGRLTEQTLPIAAEFVFPVCGRCAHNENISPDAIAPGLQQLYIAERFDGSQRAAIAQPSWPVVREFLGVVRDEARRLRSSG